MAPLAKPKPITPLKDDAEFAREAGLLATFERALSDLDAETELLRLDFYLAGVGRAEDTATAALVWRRDKLRREFRESESDIAPASSASVAPEIVAAIGVLKGDEPHRPVDTAKEIEALLARRAIIHAGIIVQSEIVNDLLSRKSSDVSELLRDRHRALRLEAYHAAQRLSQVLESERLLKREIAGAGYRVQPHALPTPLAHVLTALGLETNWDSQLARYRRELEAAGIL
jgi:3-oxoacyl-ACP reductase-like protein